MYHALKHDSLIQQVHTRSKGQRKLTESSRRVDKIEEGNTCQMNTGTSGIFGETCWASNIKLTQYHPVTVDTSICSTIILGRFKKILRNLLVLDGINLKIYRLRPS